jgi:membrane protein YdbS with pleckstrin-like domain
LFLRLVQINVIFSANVHILYLSISLSPYMWSSTLYTKYILVLSVMNLFIIPTIYLNFILILSSNQKAIFMGSLMQWLYLERMKVYYPIKICESYTSYTTINYACF